MYKQLLRNSTRFAPAFVPFVTHKNQFDHDALTHPATDTPETGWDRVKKMYNMNEMNELSYEMHNVAHTCFSGAFMGACIGGFYHSRNAYIYFVENNQATIFKTPLQAKKKLQDYVLVAFCKGAYTWGWRLAAFMGIFSLTVNTMSVYSGETRLVDYIAAGAFTGALYKTQLGPVAMLVGAGLGAVLSTIGGITILGILKITGVSMQDIKKALYKIKEAREDQMRQVEAKSGETKNDVLIASHDRLLEQRQDEDTNKI